MKIGFLGTGNMGGALAKAAAKADMQLEIMLANRSAAKAEKLAEELRSNSGAFVSVNGVKEVAAAADYIFIGVKPQMLEDLFDVIAPILANRDDRFVLVSMAAGTSIDRINELAGQSAFAASETKEYPVIRIMPNTPAAIGEGMTLYDSKAVTDAEMADFLEFMKYSGRLSRLSEKLIDAGSAVSGCGPAFAYMFAEALADGGVACGLPRKDAIEYASQMLKGAAAMILETGENPGKLKDDVCSPGGTTIQGVRRLEEGAFRGDVMNAVIAAYEKTKKL